MITDGAGDLSRLLIAVRAAFAGGCRCVQVREPGWSGRQLWDACAALRPVVRDHEGLLLVNDRLDLARADGADGAQVGHRSLPPEAARHALGSGAAARILGARRGRTCRGGARGVRLRVVVSCVAHRLQARGAAVRSREGRDAHRWREPAGHMARRCHPCGLRRAPALAPRARPHGLAAMSGVLDSADPAEACRLLLDALP